MGGKNLFDSGEQVEVIGDCKFTMKVISNKQGKETSKMEDKRPWGATCRKCGFKTVIWAENEPVTKRCYNPDCDSKNVTYEVLEMEEVYVFAEFFDYCDGLVKKDE
jgi:hypothetical protein